MFSENIPLPAASASVIALLILRVGSSKPDMDDLSSGLLGRAPLKGNLEYGLLVFQSRYLRK